MQSGSTNRKPISKLTALPSPLDSISADTIAAALQPYISIGPLHALIAGYATPFKAVVRTPGLFEPQTEADVKKQQERRAWYFDGIISMCVENKQSQTGSVVVPDSVRGVYYRMAFDAAPSKSDAFCRCSVEPFINMLVDHSTAAVSICADPNCDGAYYMGTADSIRYCSADRVVTVLSDAATIEANQTGSDGITRIGNVNAVAVYDQTLYYLDHSAKRIRAIDISVPPPKPVARRMWRVCGGDFGSSRMEPHSFVFVPASLEDGRDGGVMYISANRVIRRFDTKKLDSFTGGGGVLETLELVNPSGGGQIATGKQKSKHAFTGIAWYSMCGNSSDARRGGRLLVSCYEGGVIYSIDPDSGVMERIGGRETTNRNEPEGMENGDALNGATFCGPGAMCVIPNVSGYDTDSRHLLLIFDCDARAIRTLPL